jgi:hypothetical protein
MSAPRQPKPSIVIGDAEYLKVLSGAKQRGAVRDWCRKNGIKTFNNRDGWPVTTAAELDRAISGDANRAEPDWSYFDRWKTSPHWRHKRMRQEAGIPEPPELAKSEHEVGTDREGADTVGSPQGSAKQRSRRRGRDNAL